MNIREAIAHAKQVAEGCSTENRDCAYQHDKLADWLEELVAYRGTSLTPERVAELAQAEKDGRLVVLPEVLEADRKLFTDNLKDVFDEWANYDPSVGIFGMSDGEAALANALMRGLVHAKD